METRLGPYRILRLIKSGGQGQVFLAYDSRLRRRAAIKIHELPDARRARQQLLREARRVASVHSPKVVQVYDVLQSSGHLALVMEYVPGCDLEELLSGTRPSVASSLRIAADIAAGIAAARQRRLVHGDLKAANILISSEGRAKLSDFGIARETGAQQAGGSASALAPEQLDGQPLDVRSDLFALGRLLYRLLTGEDPFLRDAKLQVDALRAGQYRPLQECLPPDMEVPQPLLVLVPELLQADPARRPANTHRVRRLLRQALHGLPLLAEGSLLREAQPFFRQESPQDLPPPVPVGMGRQARSRLRLRRRLLPRGPWRVPVVLTSLALVVAAVALYQARPVPLLHLAEPEIQLESAQHVPALASGRWLSQELASTLRQRLGRVRLQGAVPIERYISGEEGERLPDEELRSSLRCGSLFCVFALERSAAGGSEVRQALLFPDASESRWRQVVRDTTLALYD